LGSGDAFFFFNGIGLFAGYIVFNCANIAGNGWDSSDLVLLIRFLGGGDAFFFANKDDNNDFLELVERVVFVGAI
jgi:hypothetical protein